MHVIDDKAIARAGIHASDLVEPVSLALAAHAKGEMVVEPKHMLIAKTGAYAIGTHGIWGNRDLTFFHNLVGLDREPVKGQRSTYRSSQVLFRSSDATPLLMIHGNTMSSVLPVVMTIITAQHFAPINAQTISFIGVGLQAKLHLNALAQMYPITRIFCYSRSQHSAMALVEHAESLGIKTEICMDPRSAVSQGDIVISAISESFGVKPFLDTDWLKPHAFLSSVDMLRPWLRGSNLRPLVIADDALQAQQMIKANRVPNTFSIDHELGALLADRKSTHGRDKSPVILLHPGCCAGLFGMAIGLQTHPLLTD